MHQSTSLRIDWQSPAEQYPDFQLIARLAAACVHGREQLANSGLPPNHVFRRIVASTEERLLRELERAAADGRPLSIMCKMWLAVWLHSVKNQQSRQQS